MKKLLVFASGSKTGGGSGFEKLVEASRSGVLEAQIEVVSNHEHGGVRERADRLGIKFHYFPGPFPKFGAPDAEEIQKRVDAEALRIFKETGADFVAFSGWLKLIRSLPPEKTFNIHPGRLPRFGGPGMWGHHVHQATIEAFNRGEVKHSAVTMHFVTPHYDEGPILFELLVPIEKGDTAETLGARVNQLEHEWQPQITGLIVDGFISYDVVRNQVIVPRGYPYLPNKSIK